MTHPMADVSNEIGRVTATLVDLTADTPREEMAGICVAILRNNG